MALNGSITTNGYDGRKYTLSWEVTSQSIVDNTSTLYWKISCAGGDDDWYAERTVKAIIDGTTVKYKTERIVRYENSKIYSGYITLSHNVDGTRSFSLSLQVACFTSAINLTASGTGVLDTIPRASDFTIADGTLGVAQNITVTRQSTAFTHGLTYSCGSVSTQLICPWDTTAESVPFTPPLDLAWQAVNGTRVWVDIHLVTYDSSGATIGNVVTKGVWMTIPESVKPSCTVAVSDPTGHADKFGGYIQGQSKLTIKVTPQTAYGSPIAGYLIMADGNKYPKAEVTTDVVQSTGEVEIYADVTDTRGRLGSTSTPITVIPYTTPTITQLKVHRCDADGTDNDRGLHVRVNYGYVVDSIGGKNGMSGYIQYKKTTEPGFTSVELPKAFSVEEGTYIFEADDAASYDVQLLIADSFARADSSTVVSTGFTIVHFSPSGKGMNIGGIHNGEGFRLYNIPFYIEDVEVDYIVEQGEIDGWFYRKWNGGFAECWKVYYASVNSGKTNYSGFYYSDTIVIPFPFTFTNLPTVTVDGGSVSYMNFVRSFGKYSDKASFVVVSMTNAGTVDVTVDIKAIGRWK